jgi:hypothetical protein
MNSIETTIVILEKRKFQSSFLGERLLAERKFNSLLGIEIWNLGLVLEV